MIILVWRSCLHFLMVLHFVMAWSRFVPYWLWYAGELWERNKGLVSNQSIDKVLRKYCPWFCTHSFTFYFWQHHAVASNLYSRCNTKWTMDKAELVGVPLAHTGNCNQHKIVHTIRLLAAFEHNLLLKPERSKLGSIHWTSPHHSLFPMNGQIKSKNLLL